MPHQTASLKAGPANSEGNASSGHHETELKRHDDTPLQHAAGHSNTMRQLGVVAGRLRSTRHKYSFSFCLRRLYVYQGFTTVWCHDSNLVIAMSLGKREQQVRACRDALCAAVRRQQPRPAFLLSSSYHPRTSDTAWAQLTRWRKGMQ